MLLGVPTLGFVLNIFAGNLRHSPFWLRFPAWLERWFLSPAQHQLHHSADPVHYDANYGTWLAIWDRMMGRLPSGRCPALSIWNSRQNATTKMICCRHGWVHFDRVAMLLRC